MEDKMAFGKFVTKKRKENNLTQKELAERLYVSESAVSKWERGISYPDISLIVDICKVLKVSEHELITASEDLHQHEIERQAIKFKRAITAYERILYIIYGVTLLVCFICNLAVNRTLSWFFIVLTAEAVAFSLTSLPLIFQENRWIKTIISFFITLNLLLLVCCIYTRGDWFLVSFTALLFAFAVVFLPYIIRNIELSGFLYSHKALICISEDTILLFVLIWFSSLYENYTNRFFTIVCPVTLVSISLPWLFLIIIRYVKVNALFKASICFAVAGVYMFLTNSILGVIIDKKPFILPKYNLGVWTQKYINGNVTLITTILLVTVAIILCIGGVVMLVRRQEKVR